MLSQEHIADLIKRYSKTTTGAAEIAKKKKGKFVAKTAPDGKHKQSAQQASKIGNDMKEILFRKISRLIQSFKIEDIIVERPVLRGDAYFVSIRFNEEALRRESLDPSNYPEGITNIIKLFITGYEAKGAVYGVWKGHGGEEIWSLRHRDPNDFMENAVNEFNSKYKNVARAELSDEYKNNI